MFSFSSSNNSVNPIIPVILAGGSGTRLWPLSQPKCPKQFIKLCGDKTLFQETLARIKLLPHVTSPIIVCNKEHQSLVLEQLQELEMSDGAFLILEPVGRNTASAAAIAAMAALERGGGDNAVLLVLPADHAIADVTKLHAAILAAHKYAIKGNLMCFGVMPSRAETGYGYIKVGVKQGNTDVFKIAEFVEKPNQELAKQYLQSRQYYWNSGMFMFGAKKYLEELERFAPNILNSCKKTFHVSCVEALQNNMLPLNEAEFSKCCSNSIDYAIMEHTKQSLVLPLDAGWNDVGSWQSLWEYMVKDTAGNVFVGNNIVADGCLNSYIHANSRRKVVALGVEDLIVVETDEAILVVPKGECQKLKSFIEKSCD